MGYWTDERIEMLGERYASGERTHDLLEDMEDALNEVKLGHVDASWGMGLDILISGLRKQLQP